MDVKEQKGKSKMYSERLKYPFVSSQISNFERVYGLASFNRIIYYHVLRQILDSTLRRIVVCTKQRVRLLLGELHNLILFRVATTAANISLRDCSRAYAPHSQNLRLRMSSGATHKTWH